MGKQRNSQEPPNWLIGGIVFLLILFVLGTGMFFYVLGGTVDDAAFSRLNAKVTFIGSWATFLSAVLAFAAVWFARQSIALTEATLEEERAARLAQTRPLVFVSFDRDGDNLVLVVGHYGGGPARNVRFQFKGPLVNEDGEDIGAKPPFSTGLPLVPPGFKRTERFGSFVGYRDLWVASSRPDGRHSHPAKFAVTISLYDPQARDKFYSETYVLDATPLFEFNLPQWQAATRDDLPQGLQWPEAANEAGEQ